jgi:segregation and condensation protein A
MDLLLYLIARQEVEIQEVEISTIVDQYLAYLDQLKEHNVDISSDFLVMASTLILIKSKALLPTEEIDLEEEIDQQDDLIQHLMEYKKVKILSRALQEKADHRGLLYARATKQDYLVEDDTIDEEELNLWDIIKAFAKIVKDTGLDKKFEVMHTDKPIIVYISSILDKLASAPRLPFEELFVEEKTRGEAISLFVGLLELAKRNMIKVTAGEGVNELNVQLTFDLGELAGLKEDGVYHIERLTPEEEEEPVLAFEPEVQEPVHEPLLEDPFQEEDPEPAPAEEKPLPPAEESSAEGAF